MGNHGGRAVEQGMTGTAGAAGGPWAAQGSGASPRLWHASGGRSWHPENGDLIPLYGFCSLTSNGEESL